MPQANSIPVTGLSPQRHPRLRSAVWAGLLLLAASSLHAEGGDRRLLQGDGKRAASQGAAADLAGLGTQAGEISALYRAQPADLAAVRAAGQA